MLDVRVDLALYPDILRRRLASLSVLANSSTLSSSESLHIQPLESRMPAHVTSIRSSRTSIVRGIFNRWRVGSLQHKVELVRLSSLLILTM